MAAPLWFKAPFKVLQLFVREKLRDRIYTGNGSDRSGGIFCQDFFNSIVNITWPGSTLREARGYCCREAPEKDSYNFNKAYMANK